MYSPYIYADGFTLNIELPDVPVLIAECDFTGFRLYKVDGEAWAEVTTIARVEQDGYVLPTASVDLLTVLSQNETIMVTTYGASETQPSNELYVTLESSSTLVSLGYSDAVTIVVDAIRRVTKLATTSIDTVRQVTKQESISVDTVRRVSKLEALTIDTVRRVTKLATITVDTLRQVVVGGLMTITVDAVRRVSKLQTIVVDAVRRVIGPNRDPAYTSRCPRRNLTSRKGDATMIGPLYDGEEKTIAGDFTDDLELAGESAVLSNPGLEVYLNGEDVTEDVVISSPVVSGNAVIADVQAINPENVYSIAWTAEIDGKPTVITDKMVVLTKTGQ